MSSLDQSIRVNKIEVKNRILMPPLVCFNWADDKGFETHDRASHYGLRAKGGAGVIVIEATAILKSGRLCDTELGLWDDAHIPQFIKMADACRENKSLSLVQLVHAGDKSVGPMVYGASPLKTDAKECLEMTLEQINEVKEAFVKAAVRAKTAGLDGVEIHGAHGYLLSQFASSKSNKRTDGYGGTLENRMRLGIEIVKAVREATGPDFVVGYRYGVNDPSFEEDIIFVKELERAGVDLLNVSSGIVYGDVEVPADFEFSQITYMGSVIKRHTDIPVACVFGIRYPEQAEKLVKEGHCDFVALGRAILADPNWGIKAIAGESVNVCYHCKPRCKYGTNGNECPWRLKELKR
ncbi:MULTISPECIES: NADH:flavin oxidoreductase [unclassified Fusibacter]|uniref:oxidoreductase n=1 Tax=unclassified Fusibacter TaxID=2624464 RepID=UPI001010AC4F|nr:MULTISPECIES: NADH:flavin oxidoreductase [unclassified Fusibacter]MCK8060133.1 NADH:flavin oxidoreductase [Fusibacter sp. A2]NPE22275.1 NADH:flavin oxidoreductase [Fusibacter sp. A1]RXV61048.1 NADH:flavin oxidoreductase [Fusibacter sp. A1]